MSAIPPPPPPGSPPPAGDPPGYPPSPQESRYWALGAHLSALVVLVGLPLPFLGPLVVWALRKDSDPYVAEHAREALNFNLTAMIAFLIAGASIIVLIGFLLLPIIGIAWLVLVIIGGVKASNGELYRYPLTIRFVS